LPPFILKLTQSQPFADVVYGGDGDDDGGVLAVHGALMVV